MVLFIQESVTRSGARRLPHTIQDRGTPVTTLPVSASNRPAPFAITKHHPFYGVIAGVVIVASLGVEALNATMTWYYNWASVTAAITLILGIGLAVGSLFVRPIGTRADQPIRAIPYAEVVFTDIVGSEIHPLAFIRRAESEGTDYLLRVIVWRDMRSTLVFAGGAIAVLSTILAVYGTGNLLAV